MLALFVAFAAPVLEPLEMTLVQAVLGWRTLGLTTAVQVGAFIASAVPCAVVMAALSGVLLLRQTRTLHPVRWLAHWRQLWPGLIFAGSIASNIALRIWIGRLPPQVAYLPGLLPEVYASFHQFSFPSGHASTALVTYLVAVPALLKLGSSSMQLRWQKPIFGLILLIILFAGFGRVYLGVHWPSDVLGGYLLGLFWVGIGARIRPRR